MQSVTQISKRLKEEPFGASFLFLRQLYQYQVLQYLVLK